MQNLSCIDDMTSMPARERPHLVVTDREIHACEFADFVIANFASDNVFCHSLNLSKEVVNITEVIYSAGKGRLHVLTGEVREVFRDCTAG